MGQPRGSALRSRPARFPTSHGLSARSPTRRFAQRVQRLRAPSRARLQGKTRHARHAGGGGWTPPHRPARRPVGQPRRLPRPPQPPHYASASQLGYRPTLQGAHTDSQLVLYLGRSAAASEVPMNASSGSMILRSSRAPRGDIARITPSSRARPSKGLPQQYQCTLPNSSSCQSSRAGLWTYSFHRRNAALTSPG